MSNQSNSYISSRIYYRHYFHNPAICHHPVTPDIYSCFVPQYTDEIAQEVIDANGSNVFYYATDDAGNEAIITEEEGLAKMKESMQASTAQPSV